MDINIFWWNPGLLDGAGGIADDGKREAAIQVIISLVTTCNADILGFCEVSGNDIEKIEILLGALGFGVHPLTGGDGRINFNMCIAYRLDKLRIVDGSTVKHVDREGDLPLRLGVSLTLEVAGGQYDDIVAICSHWPSRRNDFAENSIPRHELGNALRRIVKQHSQCATILIGDYNDEPYSDSIFKCLGAIRDYSLAIKNNKIYNPFWRHLPGTRYPAQPNQKNRHGSHFYSRKHQTWWLFDQIMFSHHFIGNSRWHLDENSTGIIEIEDLEPIVDFGKTHFDHLPVYARVHWTT